MNETNSSEDMGEDKKNGSESSISFKTIGSYLRECWFPDREGDTDEPLKADQEDIYFATLGRFDILYVRRFTPLQKWPLPSLEAAMLPASETSPDSAVLHRERGKPDQETFLPYFERRDLFIPFWLGPDDGAGAGVRSDPDHPGEDGGMRSDCRPGRFPFGPGTRPIALVAISLGQRGYRLEFLRQLLPRVMAGAKSERQEAQRANISELGYFGPHDWAFLAEGSGDLMIVFDQAGGTRSGDAESNRLDDVFNFQKRAFDDFCVDRTEVLLTRESLPFALRSDDYEICVRVRMVEDRVVRNFIGEFERSMADRSKETRDFLIKIYNGRRLSEKLKKVYESDLFTVSCIPGRFDIEIRFDREMLLDFVTFKNEELGRGGKSLDGRSIMKAMAQIVHLRYNCEVTMIIGRRVPLRAASPG